MEKKNMVIEAINGGILRNASLKIKVVIWVIGFCAVWLLLTPIVYLWFELFSPKDTIVEQMIGKQVVYVDKFQKKREYFGTLNKANYRWHWNSVGFIELYLEIEGVQRYRTESGELLDLRDVRILFGLSPWQLKRITLVEKT